MTDNPRVYELAAELGCTSKQLIAELHRLGEYVKSASRTVAPAVVRTIRRAFATDVAPTEDAVDILAPGIELRLSTFDASTCVGETFGEELQHARAESARLRASGRNKWVSPVRRALLRQLTPLDTEPSQRDLREASRQHRQWAEACLHGLDDDEAVIAKWIDLTGGRYPMVAARLSREGITPDEAGLRLSNSGRIDMQSPSLFVRFRARKLTLRQALTAVTLWRAMRIARGQ
ncbi:translation initiation factor IF-2 N-terminal domain-containing protein [Mycobacterium sp. NPDC003323]